MRSTITTDKRGLRKLVKEYYVTETDRSQSDRQLAQRFLALPQVREACSILLFYGVGTEPDTRPILDALFQSGKQVSLPHCLPGNQMEARLYRGPEHCVTGAYDIVEPDEGSPVMPRDRIDLILVPDLLCDRRGYRLGHGAGYYDRYLVGFTGFTVALCRDALLRDAIPTDQYDIPMDLILTETQCLSIS